MSDLFESLRHLDHTVPGPALAAPEVRRRGDRMRRRRTLLRAAAAACAIAVVATGGVALAGGGLTDPAPPPPATEPPSPSPRPSGSASPEVVEWRTGIPDGFPLDLGFPEDRFDGDELKGPAADVVPFADVEACGDRIFPTVRAVETLGSTFSRPEDWRARQLLTYPDDVTARASIAALVDGFRGCPRQRYEGPPESATLTDVVELGSGDEGYVVVRTYESDGFRGIGLELVHAVRVGNAVLVATVANEGGGAQADVNRQLDEQSALVSQLVDQMCVFSASGCPRPQPSRAAQPGLDPALLELRQIEQLTADLRTDWAQTPDRANPTLDCQADWLSSLGPDRSAYREFAGTSASGVVNTEAATAVLEFADPAAAAAAYDEVAGWVTSCDSRMDGTRPVGTAHDPVAQRTGYGPATWRVVESRAPEICTECHTGWIDAQGVALVGSRVVLLSIAYTGDMMTGADTARSPMNDGISLAASRASTSPTPTDGPTLGPQGVGPVALGDSGEEAERTGGVTFEDGHGQSCTSLGVLDGDAVLATGFLTENQGVSVLLVDTEGIVTPEGVGIGATEEQVRAAYPEAEDVATGLLAPVPGFGDRRYTFAFEDGRLAEMSLRLEQQTCVG